MIESFLYRPIGEALFSNLQGRLEAGDSLALIAPRYGGGRYAMYHLTNRLRESGMGPVLFLKLSHREPVTGEADLRRRLAEAATQESGDEGGETANGEALLAAVDRIQEKAGKPVILLVRSIDSLPYGLTRRLLEEIRTRVQSEGTLVTVLNGEANFSDLVHGPNSEFNCVERFFLQGLDKAEFSRFVDSYSRSVHLVFADREAAHCKLWQRTGGSRHLLRMILWDVLERLTRRGWDGAEILDAGELDGTLEGIELPGLYGTEIFEHAARLIDHEPRCWSDLQTLLRGEPVNTGGPHSPPGPLELAGVAVRREEMIHQEVFWTLGFSSPLIAGFIQSQYHARRWGDLYMRDGQSERAFEFYQKIPWEDGARPATADDRIDTELTVRSLGGPLHVAVAQGSREVRRLFARCCHYVLGYRDVAFLLFQGGQWSLEAEESFFSTAAHLLREAAALLPAGDWTSSGIIPVPPPWNRFAVAAVLPTHRRDQQCALLLGDFTTQAFISRQREQLTRDFFASFLAAYSQALEMEHARERLSVRDRHLEVINSIFDALGSRILDVRHALAMAARGLRKLSYSRVIFCLVTPEGDRIKGELDDSEDLRVNVAEMTDWPLSNPMADLQPFVISTRKPKVVENPALEPLANPKVLSRTRMKSFVIVPLLNPSGEAIGTVHVERNDGAVPSEAEVKDLLLFGRQLAIAIEQSERVNLLQSALDQMPEPVLITDRNRRLRYANQPAAELFGLTADWRGRNQAEELAAETVGQPIRDLLDRSLESGIRQVRHIHKIRDQEYHGAALSDDILDWRKRTVGALLHIEDLNYLYRILRAIEVIAEANNTDSAMRSMLRAAGILGHERGKLFLVDKDDPKTLTGGLSLEQGSEIVEGERIVLPRQGEPGFRTWVCIEQREPIVVCWIEEREDLEVITTPTGLQATNSKPPRCPNELEKKPGDFWIDFPLITNQGVVLGKLSLSCDENLQPEQFELIKVLSAIASGLFDAFLRRDQMNEQMLAYHQSRALWAAAEETMALAAHNIATRLASLAVLLLRYRRREHLSSDLRKLNDEFRDLYTEIMQTISRIKERLSLVKPDFRRIDLVAKIRSTFESALPQPSWSLQATPEVLEVDCDSHLFGNALLEMIQNSQELIEDADNLHIAVTLTSQQLLTAEWVQIICQDNGPGVPQEFKSEIFKPFFTRRPGRKTGTGVGLRFVRQVVEAHGGVIYENGVPGSGAKFVIGFPRFIEASNKET